MISRILISLVLLNAINSQTCSLLIGCAKCNPEQTLCTECNFRVMYFLQNGKCVHFDADTNCRKIDQSGKCTLCAQTHFLDLQNACQLIQPIPRCLVYESGVSNSKTTCRVCEVGFELGPGDTCINPIDNCQTLSATDSTCQACQAGFRSFTQGNTCTYDIADPNCRSFDPVTGECLGCAQGFSLAAGLCSRQLSNCLCPDSTAGHCKFCQSGFRQDDSGLCVALPPGDCSQFHPSTSLCLVCNPGFFVSSGECRPHAVASCQAYQSNKNLCSLCRDGHYLTAEYACLPQSSPRLLPIRPQPKQVHRLLQRGA
jgi:proprotein convertase subtilisin/kexin type 5